MVRVFGIAPGQISAAMLGIPCMQTLMKLVFFVHIAYHYSMKQILLAFFLSLCAPAAYAEATLQQPLQVVVYGDALTAGEGLRPDQLFSAQLQSLLKASGFEVDVINMSDATQTTANARANLDTVIGKAPDMVIVQLAENDIKTGISATIIRDNLYKIVFPMQSKGIYVIVMGTRPSGKVSKEYAEHVATTFIELGKNAPLYPNTLAGIAGKTEMTLADGYLPNARGVELMVRGVYPAVDAGLRWKMKVIAMRQGLQPEAAAPAPMFDAPPPVAQ